MTFYFAVGPSRMCAPCFSNSSISPTLPSPPPHAYTSAFSLIHPAPTRLRFRFLSLPPSLPSPSVFRLSSLLLPAAVSSSSNVAVAVAVAAVSVSKAAPMCVALAIGTLAAAVVPLERPLPPPPTPRTLLPRYTPRRLTIHMLTSSSCSTSTIPQRTSPRTPTLNLTPSPSLTRPPPVSTRNMLILPCFR